MRLLLASFIFVLLFTIGVLRPIYASNSYNLPDAPSGKIDEALLKIVPVRFLPSSPFYFLIWAKENFNRLIKPSPLRKAEFDFVLSGKRLKEAYLLLEKNNVKNSSAALNRYSRVAEKTVDELKKAKNQSQDVATAAGIIDGGLLHQLILLSAIEKKVDSFANDYNFNTNFSSAIDGFSQIVKEVDQISPGVGDKYLPK